MNGAVGPRQEEIKYLEFKLSLVEWVRFREMSMNKGRHHEKENARRNLLISKVHLRKC